MSGYDVLLRGGWVADGSGAPLRRADVGVAGDAVIAVGALDPAAARTVVDVTDRYVLPGFIDAHSHADGHADDPAVVEAALRQGVTTVIVGQDGLAFAPASAGTVAAVERYFGAVDGRAPEELRGGGGIADLLAHYDGRSALNVATLVPAATVRIEVAGYARGALDAEATARAVGMIERGLEEGAVGLSTGLEYAPGGSADIAELARMTAPVTAAGAVHVSHMRGYEADAWRGMDELRRLMDAGGGATHVSHLHGPANMILSLVDGIRAGGGDLTFDSYPYLRGSTILGMVALPRGLQSDGPDATMERLADAAVVDHLDREWFPSIADVLERITLSYVAAPDWAWTEGLSLRAAAERAGMPLGVLARTLIRESGLAAGCVFGQPPTNTEDDVRALLRHEAHLAGSDAIMMGGAPHPRGWGTFARFLARHTRDLGDWTWGEASLHLAGHAARRFGLGGRGAIGQGTAADLVVVDPRAVSDTATYEAPRMVATGVEHVLVNGTFALRDGAVTGARPGRGLRRGEIG